MIQIKIVWFLIFWATVCGIAFPVKDHFDFSYSIDAKSYIKMADGDFDVAPKHRYRPAIPWVAGFIGTVAEDIFEISKAAAINWAFFLINTLLYAAFLWAIWLLLGVFSTNPYFNTLALLPIIGSQWTAYLCGIPLTDSLYFLGVSLLVLAHYKKDFRVMMIAIACGTIGKDAFVFFMPLIFLSFYLNEEKKWFKILSSGALFTLIFISVRFLIDAIYKTDFNENTADALSHFNNVIDNILLLFSTKGALQVFGTYSFFTLLFFIPAIWTNIGLGIRKHWFPLAFLIIIFLHMILSGDLSRMFFLTAPIAAIFFLKCLLILSSMEINKKAI